MKFEFRGTDKLMKGLEDKTKLKFAKQIVKTNGAELKRKMVDEAIFKRFTPMAPKLYSTGQTRRSIEMHMSDDGLTSTTAPTTEYAEYVEYGTRFMTAQPFIKPAFNEQKELFKADLDRLVK